MNPTARFHHVAIAVSDLDRSIAWYRDKLDCRLQRRFALPEVGIRIAYLATEAGVRIELIERSRPPEGGFAGRPSSGADHLCFHVTSIDAVATELAGRGVEFVQPPKTIPEAGVRNCWIRDEAGGLIEFVEELGDG